jgi:hypothetical protein
MADETKSDKVTLEELHIGNDRRLAKLMFAKGVITDAEIRTQLSTERANYLAVLKCLH